MSNSLQPHELQHARPPCPSPTPRIHPDSCPSSRWCHPAILPSVVPFSSCRQSLPAFILYSDNPINNVVIVSSEQRRDSAIDIHISILAQTPLPSRLPHNIVQSSMYYTLGPYRLYILNVAVCTWSSQSIWKFFPLSSIEGFPFLHTLSCIYHL